MIVNASSNRSIRWSNGKPNARNSVSFQPAPRPRTKRPPLISSIVAACLASRAGLWKLVHATSGPNSTRDVIAAMAAMLVQASHGPRAACSGQRYSRCSPSQIESKPRSSMARTMSSSSGQRTSRSTSGSWMPILSGRPTAGQPAAVMSDAAIARR